jgi:[acyl-carrier-protein] S-malonyltransferase
MKTAYIFPGQGSQAIGMGKALADAFPVAKQTLQEVDDALGQHLTRLMFEGPESDLTLTQNTQPAIMACSIAALRVMETQMGVDMRRDATFVAGHSLGEYAALTAAGSLALSDTAKLLRIRGQAMQAAVPPGQGAMAAIIGLAFDEVKAVCAEASANGDVCEVANYNSDQQIVISGSVVGIERGMELAKARGAKRALPLPVSAPFHCSLMQPAADRMRAALDAATLLDPSVPLVANVTAQPVEDAKLIRDLLVQQVTGMVRWQESVQTMVSLGVTRFIEIGHGKVLSGLIKRIAPDAGCVNIGTPEDMDQLAKAA